MSQPRVPSPARSQGTVFTPQRYKPRRTQSVGSLTKATTSGRLSAIIQFSENNKNSFVLSPMPTRRSVLNDDTDIEEPRRRSWWKKLSDNSRDVMEVLNDNKILETNEAVEEFIDIEVLSQEKKNYSIDLPESSDSESISSIIIPQRKLFTQKDTQSIDKFGQLMGTRETLAKLHKSVAHEKTINVAPKNLFNQPSKPKSRPMFPAALLSLSTNKTANKTKELITVEVKGETRNLFGNRPGTKRKNMFANFIMSESEDEISDIQPKIFGFDKKDNQLGEKPTSHRRDPSPTSSINADIEMDDWRLLPSSTMVENQLEDMMASAKTPVKRNGSSKLTEALESENIATNSSLNKTKYNKSAKNDNLQKSASVKNKSKLSLIEDKNNKSTRKSKDETRSKISTSPVISTSAETPAKRPRLSNSREERNTTSEVQNISVNKSKNSHKSVTKNHSKLSPNAKSTENATEKSISTRSRANITANSDKSSNLNNMKQFINTEPVNNELISNEDDELNMSLVYDEQDEIEPTVSCHDEIDNSNKNNRDKLSDKNIDHKQNIQKSLNVSKDVILKALSHENKHETVAIEQNVNQHNPAIQNPCHYSQNEKVNVNNDTELNKDQRESVNKVHNMNQDNNQDEIEEETHDKSEKELLNEGEDNIQKDNEKIFENEVNEETQNKEKSQDNSQRNKSHSEILGDDELNQDESQEVECEEENDEIENDQHESEEQINKSKYDDTSEKAIQEENEDSLKSKEGNHELNEEVEEESKEIEEENNELEQESEDIEENNDEFEQDNEEIEDHNEMLEQEDEEIDEDNVELEQENEKVDEDSEELVQENEEADTDGEEQEQENEETDDDGEELEQETEEVDADGEELEQENEEIDEDCEELEEEIDDNDEEIEENSHAQDQHESTEEIQNTNEDEGCKDEDPPNISHDTTGRHRKKDETKVDSPEIILHDKTKQVESFTAKGRNTSLRRTSIMKNMNIRSSLAPPRDSTGFSDGRDSSAEGSGWDSHRTTRKTLRQTFGKDFSPRKSLRALVLEKSAKRQTTVNDLTAVTSKFPQANSTELPEASNIQEDNDNYDEVVDAPVHEVSKRTRQTTLEAYLQKIKKQNMERRLKIEENVKNSLKAPIRDISNTFKVPSKPFFVKKKLNSKPKAKPIKSTLIPLDDLPTEVIEDMKYKPPKRYQPSNAAWITKRLYKFLETKLEPKYDYKARVRAEKLVEVIYQFAKDLRRHPAASIDAVDNLKYEMARLDIVKSHFDFYQFFTDFMPREVRVKVVPDVMNKLPMPRHGVFSDILRGNTVQG